MKNTGRNGNRLNRDPFKPNLVPRWKKSAVHLNKDRNRKIVTAQGCRDRRVRLSIQIARKFFDLQDTLGFDKASKTLEWLFTKSKSAIEELVKMKHSCCKTSAAVIEQDPETNNNEAAEIGDNLKRMPLIRRTTCSVRKEKRMSILQQHKKNSTAFSLLSRESRAKARERARDRTKEKMSIRKLNESRKLGPDFSLSIPSHSSSWNQLPYFGVGTEISQTIAESILFKRNYSQQVPLNSSRVAKNWDISTSFSQGIPLATDFHNCAKLREEIQLPDHEYEYR